MRRVVFGLFLAILGFAVIGHVSGNQPGRDSVAAARSELGIELESRFVDVGDVTLHVVLAGPADGPPVVLLHGFPEFWYAWRGAMGVLARAGFRVIAPDQRGYHLSDKPAAVEAYRVDHLAADIAGLIAALGFDDAYLVGHDWGGGVAWRTVIEHSRRVRKLVVLDTPHPRAGEGFTSGEERVSWYRTYLQIPWLPGWTARFGNWALLANALRNTSRPGTFPDSALDQFRSAWDHDGSIHAMGKWYRAEYPPLAGEGRVAVPTLVLVAAKDAFIPGDLTRRSGLFLDAGEVRELGSGTHWVIQEEPQRIGEILVEFFGGAPGRH